VCVRRLHLRNWFGLVSVLPIERAVGMLALTCPEELCRCELNVFYVNRYGLVPFVIFILTCRHVEAGYITSTVTVRVVDGDGKGTQFPGL
jgi:hypothetical protein